MVLPLLNLPLAYSWAPGIVPSEVTLAWGQGGNSLFYIDSNT